MLFTMPAATCRTDAHRAGGASVRGFPQLPIRRRELRAGLCGPGSLAGAVNQGLHHCTGVPVNRYRTTLWPHYKLRSSWWYGHPASTYSARLLVGELSVLIAGAGRTATPGRWPCRDGAGACARARIQRPSGGGEVRTRPVPASVNGAEITFIQGDIVTSLADLLVNPVDCAGAMTDGATRRFKAVYPEVHREYRAECLEGIVKPGTVRLLRGKDGGKTDSQPHGQRHPGDALPGRAGGQGNHRT